MATISDFAIRHYKKALWVLFGAAIAYFMTGGCLFRTVTGIPCPGCGMTHAFLAAFRLDFADAFRWHPLFPLVMLLIAGYAICLAVYLIRRRDDITRIRPADIGVMSRSLVESVAVRVVLVLYAALFMGVYLIRMWYYYKPF
jgi:hypothetical protein